MIIDWSIAKALSNMKMVASTSIWVFLVPILLKFFNFAETFSLNIDSGSGSIPISFLYLYFSGVCFFLGALINSIFSPKILSEYDNYSSFLSKGGNSYKLQCFLDHLDQKDTSKLKFNLCQKIDPIKPDDIDSGKVSYINIGREKDVLNYLEENEKDVFWIIYTFFENRNKALSGFSILFHFFGFSLLLYLLACNFLVVVNMI